ncbi:arginyl-tRNA synthetase [Sclerotinia sclerotiorum 1980 UF-70]|uniref:arginine--tRNA ligase n=2 Tax=Sclerotinia sclerotiorum (strain ATCC 18683 / 1980 / Ss-1) TaxID=665079 RepID=A7EM60_SCLS1|nr:arginyl-tRNA synthetase [Sclerotinia sclerotiorum 1980 UF-70]EDO03926.1 arginyl-tRNA synthetase [Sclerotinia sclerotiorum 1980 UF-70]
MIFTFSILRKHPNHCLKLIPTSVQTTPRFKPHHFNSFRTFTTTLYKMAATDSSSNFISEKLKSLSVSDLPKFPNCHPDVNVVDIYRAHITSTLTEITGVESTIIYRALAWTNTLDKGDIVLPVPALRVKGKKPNELAEEWAAKYPESPLVHKPTTNGVYLQFFFKADKLNELLIPTIIRQGSNFGENKYLGLVDPEDPSKGQKKIVIEFSSPNIAKPFHAGHLRSTIIGGFLSNLYAAVGWNVTRVNYLGDWGKQYGLLALGFDRYGDEEALKADPINHLFQIYVKINQDVKAEADKMAALEAEGKTDEALHIKNEGLDEQARRYFKAMTENDENAIAQWARFRELSIKRYRETYARLNIHFDDYSGESQVKAEVMEETGKKMEEMKIAEESQGAMIVDFTKHVPGKIGKGLGKAIVKRRDGTALYLTRDISELLQRKEKYDFDQMIYVVATDQELHLQQLFKIIELLGYKELRDKCQHINFGLVHGMSTRRGTVKFLDDILRDVAEKMHEVMQKNEAKYEQIADPLATSDILGISSVMVQDMSGKRVNGYTFNMDTMTSFEGDTGPYLQYAHARLCSITRKAALTAEEIASADLSLLTEIHAQNLIRTLSQYPDVVQNTVKTLEPTTILTYLFKMTHVLSSSYDHLRIMGSEKEVMKARMALYDAARVVLYNGMRILGLSPVERM